MGFCYGFWEILFGKIMDSSRFIRSIIDFFSGLNDWYLGGYMLGVWCEIREWLNYGVLLWFLGDII